MDSLRPIIYECGPHLSAGAVQYIYSSACKLRMCMHASITFVLLLFCARRDIVHECTTVDHVDVEVYLERFSIQDYFSV